MDQALSLKRKTVEQILVEPIDDEGDPLLLYGLHSEEQQHSFATTCGNSPVPKPVTSLTPVRLTHKFPRRVEYCNVTELKDVLRRRLEAMTGKIGSRDRDLSSPAIALWTLLHGGCC